MKKKSLVFLTVISIGFLTYWIVSPPYSFIGSKSKNDTLWAKKYSDSAKVLVQNNPESAIILYKKAIKKLESVPADDKVRHLLANTYVDLSSVYIPQGKYDKAKQLRDKARMIAGETDLDSKAQVLLQEGISYYHQSQYEEALKCYGQAQIIEDKIKNPRLQINLISNVAIINYQQGNTKRGIESFNKALQLAKELKDPVLISEAYANLGIVYINQMEYSRARECYKMAIEFYRKTNQQQDLMFCYRNLGSVFYMLEKNDEALDWYKKSLELALKLDNKTGIAKGYHNIGEVYMLIGDYVQANNAFIQSLKIKEAIGDKASMAKGYRSLGDLYFLQKNFYKSLLYQQKALQINTSLELVKEQAKDYANISSIYGEWKQLAKAIAYANKAVKLAQQIDDTYGVAEDIRTLGGLYYQQKNYAQAELYYQKAVALKMTMTDQEGLASVYSQLAELYSSKPATGIAQKNNHQIALTYGLKAWELAQNSKIPRLLSEVSHILAEIYKKTGNYPKAYHFLEINKQTNDSIFSKSKTEALTFAETRWNTEKKQQQIASLEKLNKAISAQKLAEAKRHTFVVFGLIVLFVLVIVVAGLYWMYRYKQREITHQKQLSRISILRLQNIRNRISPHFIFNVLHREISSEADKKKYQEMMGLVTFLRRSLEITEKTSVSLDEELNFVKNYLQMEQRSLDDDFRVQWDIDQSVDAQLLKIPAMIMQIPIENAMKHALRPKVGEKLLQISIVQMANAVQIAIQDNGNGYNPEQITNTKGTGTGLKVLYQTIQLLNTKNIEKIIFNIADVIEEAKSGTKVEITIPTEYNFEWS